MTYLMMRIFKWDCGYSYCCISGYLPNSKVFFVQKRFRWMSEYLEFVACGIIFLTHNNKM